ncbi:MAG: adenine deaminase [Chitinophagaceae bacterium]
MHSITGQLVDTFEKRIYPAIVSIENGKIARIDPFLSRTLAGEDLSPPSHFILPGFIDAHVHIESSMLVPSEFARLAVIHGTVGTVSDPHEIANVCGVDGVQYMIDNGNTVPFKFNFGAPSCVPATGFETAGASLDVTEVSHLLQRPEIKYLSEMMNFPGVVSGEKDVMEKIKAAHRNGKPVDGHAPGLRGEQARLYINAGITTDHECFTRDEALEKLELGMKIIIREGSAARNFEALIELLHDYPDRMMFCSDDKHPDSLLDGHINQLCERAVAKGINIFNVLRAACVNPVLHYDLDIGLLREDDAADFIIVEDLTSFKVLQTFIDGELVAENGRSYIKTQEPFTINQFSCSSKQIKDFVFPVSSLEHGALLPVIEAIDGQLITNRLEYAPKVVNNNVVSDPQQDILKMVVVNRYHNAPISKALIKNVGLKAGAIASSVAHDSHNIVAVGVDDDSLCKAVNLVIRHKGGISCVGPSVLSGEESMLTDYEESVLSLPIAGLMSAANGFEIAQAYTEIDKRAKKLGSGLSAPFMTLSFMALLVIPHLKLSDKGLFDGDDFRLLP